MGKSLTRLFDNKTKQGLFVVLVLCLISFVINTLAKNEVSEDLRISVTAFTVAAVCALGLKFLVARMRKKAE